MLALNIFGDSTRVNMLADWSARIHRENGGGGLRFSTGAHGFAALEIPLVPMTLEEAFEVYSWPGTPHVVASDGAAVVWEGRLEDIAIVDGGVRCTAFGYSRAYWDAPYTALWSKTGSGDWKEVTTDQYAGAQPQLYEMDNNNRLYIAPRKGEEIRVTTNDTGMLTYAVPHGSGRNITNISFDYSVSLPANWLVTIYTMADNFTSIYNDRTITATGSLQTGSVSETFTVPNARIAMAVRNDTGSLATITGDTGDVYAKLTNIRIKTTTAASVLASDIAAALESYIDGINPLQVNGSAARIEATTTDLRDELYQDEYPGDILDRLALLHDYEWGVYSPRYLHFRPRGSAGREWYVDVTRIMNMERSLEEVRNSAYATYRDANGDFIRTAVADDADSQEQWGVVRRGTVRASTTSATEAGIHRDTYLSDRAARIMRADISFDHLYDASGREHPLYVLRAGDIVTMRNLAPTLSPDIDNIRSFIVGETEYDAATNRIRISPATPTPELSRLVARRDAGVR